jgi:hypothetical protein
MLGIVDHVSPLHPRALAVLSLWPWLVVAAVWTLSVLDVVQSFWWVERPRLTVLLPAALSMASVIP